MKLLHIWCDASLLARILVVFFGSLLVAYSGFFDSSGSFESDIIFDALAPVGELLVKMLKMIVIPMIFSDTATLLVASREGEEDLKALHHRIGLNWRRRRLWGLFDAVLQVWAGSGTNLSDSCSGVFAGYV